MNWEEPKRPRWLSMNVLAWALFDVGVAAFSMNVISRYFGPWVVKQMKGSIASYNDAIWISLLIAAIVQVLLSPISDELGRRRVFVLVFSLICIAACATLSMVTSLMMGLFVFGIANVGYRTSMVFYDAMLGDVSDEGHRARISGIGIGFGYLGAILGITVAARFADTAKHGYSLVFWVTAVILMTFALPLFFFLKEKPSLVRLNFAQSLTNSVGSFVTTCRRVVRHREMLFFFVGCLFALDAVSAVTVNMALYCEDVVGLDSVRGFHFSPMWKDRLLFDYTITEIDLFLVVSTVFAVFGSLIIGYISDKTSHYKALLGVLTIWVLALVLAIFSVRRKLFWFTGPLFGLGFGGIWTVSRAYLQELCHPEERSQMFALFGLVGRGAAILGTFAWARVYSISEPFFGVNRSYRISIAALLGLLIVGFWMMLLARPKAEDPPY